MVGLPYLLLPIPPKGNDPSRRRYTKDKGKVHSRAGPGRPSLLTLLVLRRARAFLVIVLVLPVPHLRGRQGNHVSNPCVPQEGQHRLRGSSIPEHLPDRGERLLPATCLLYPFSHPPRLRGQGSASSNKVEPGLALAAVAPLAAAVVDFTDLLARVGSDRCVAGEELVVWCRRSQTWNSLSCFRWRFLQKIMGNHHLT